MIKFHAVKFKNFGSFGNNSNEIQLDRHRTTLVSGMNGHGKSFALLDSITFALFGKPFRKINIPQLVNSINEKECLVEVDFSIGNDDYKVLRGIKPKVFEIHKNNRLLNQNSSAKDYQRMLEENILKMNYKSFTQVVILGSSSFVPFMQLPALDRRQVIEDVLDIQVFSDMNTVLKNRASIKKDEIREVESNIDLINSKISILEKHISDVREGDESKINLLKEEIETTNRVIEERELHLDSLLTKQSSLLEETSKMDDVKSVLSKNESMKKMAAASFEKALKRQEEMETMQNCPTCTQGISDETKELLVRKTNEKIESFKNVIQKVEDTIREANEKLDALRDIARQLKDIQDTIIRTRSETESSKRYTKKLEEDVRELMSKSVASENSETSSQLKDYKTSAVELKSKKKELKEEGILLGCVGNLLKDTGIKSKIIRHYLPIMNKLINKFLSDMGFFAQFHLDENFNETIKSRHRDSFSYMSFSEGEKMRIDLALLLAWREIARLKNSANTNILILDEVFDSSLDSVGTDEFMKLMHTLSANTNIFVISHKSDQLVDKFENQITFVKKGNFSKLI